MEERDRGQRRITEVASGLVLSIAFLTAGCGNTATIPNKQNKPEISPYKPIATDIVEMPTAFPTQTLEPSPVLTDRPFITPDLSIYSSKEAAKIMEIETRYGINIFTVKEARAYAHQNLSSSELEFFQYMGIDNWKDAKAGFDYDQLILLKQLLNYIPPYFYEILREQKFGIILLADDAKAAGADFSGFSFAGTRMIGVKKSVINLQDRKGTFSLLIHEMLHSLDDATFQAAWIEVDTILKDKNIGQIPDIKAYFANKKGLRSNYVKYTDDQKAALATFSSFVPKQEYAEGIAGIAQLYVNGYENFMNAVGPLSDGNGYLKNSKPIPVEELATRYPKAQALYDLYREMFFKGYEYNSDLLIYIEHGSQADISELETAHLPKRAR